MLLIIENDHAADLWVFIRIILRYTIKQGNSNKIEQLFQFLPYKKMNSIKIYEELSYIYTFDDKIYPTPMTVKELEIMLNQSGSRFLNLGTDLIAVSSIKRIESKKADSIDNAILRIEDKEIRSLVDAEVRKRKIEWKKLNMEIFKNILDRVTSENEKN